MNNMNDQIGCLIIDIDGKELTFEDRDILNHPLIGGVILFARNYENREQMHYLCQSMRKASQKPILIMVDQEGGRVQRFLNEFTRLPPMEVFGNLYNQEPDNACHLAKECGWLMATEILSLDIDLSLAPVLDLQKGINPAIGSRAFHADPTIVIQLTRAFIRGMREAGMAATGKHFPGHGSVAADSHAVIPHDNRSLDQIKQEDIIPFEQLIKDGIPAILAAHIIFPQLDKHPVGYSRFWLQEILRSYLGFKGVILSDDLHMEGANISDNYADRVVAAREAGCDFTLVCNHRPGVVQVLDNLDYESYQIHKNKREMLQARTQITESYQQSQRWKNTYQLLAKLGSGI